MLHTETVKSCVHKFCCLAVGCSFCYIKVDCMIGLPVADLESEYIFCLFLRDEKA